MYDQNFKNQAVKECVNGQPQTETARKYGISVTALRAWISEYQNAMAEMTGVEEQPEIATATASVKLTSINVTIDGHNITMSKQDVVKLMEIFYQFDK